MKPEEVIFEAAVALPESARTAYLNSVCAGEAALQARVQALLCSHEARGFMDESAVPAGIPDSYEAAPHPLTEESGRRIGNYKLLEQIGEGGFGTVWMAEQVEPVRRRVALKIIKPGMDSREVIARFEAERQALAMMDHPNIAKVLDAGATEKGRPYFVMELVKGIPITQFCDQQEFTTRQRLELFADVCSAINHAHQKGVIHRDIKPSNVMVTLHCEKPVPKVIDFGIAKATEGRLTDKTLFTRFEQFVGTPAYMSPEQTALSGLDVDTRSDIYSLGILLYELLTGKPPFDTRSLLSSGFEEMRRIIREVEPPKPSSRLSTAAGNERSRLAQARHVPPEKLNRLVEPDLDWIVMKSIEKDRARRYETANGLALDIQRFLSDEPVSAGPPTAGYRFRKFSRRHRTALRVGTALASVLIAATLISTWQAARAINAGKLANQKTIGEKAAREDAEAIALFLTDVFQSPDPARDGRKITVAEILDRASGKLKTGLASQPERRAKLQGALGRTYHALGLYDEAILLHQEATDYWIKAYGKKNDNSLASMRDLANSRDGKGQYGEALGLREEVVAIRMEMNGPADRETLRAKQALATSYHNHFRLSDALRLRKEVTDVTAAAFGPEDPDTLRAANALAVIYHSTYHAPEAIEMQRKALALSIKVNTAQHPDTLDMMRTLANLLRDYGDPAEAGKLRREELTLRETVNGATHSDTLRCRSELAESVFNVNHESEAAIGMLKTVVQDYTDTLGPGHRDTLFSIAKLAEFYVSSGQPEQAKVEVRKLAASPPGGAMVTLKLATLEAWLNMGAEHAETCRRALQDAANTKTPSIASRAAQGYCLLPSSDPELLTAALALARRAADLGGNEAYFAWYQLCLGMADYRNGNYEAADVALAAAENGAEKSGADRRLISDAARFYHVMSLARQGRDPQAREIFVRTAAEMKPPPVDGQALKERADHDELRIWLAFKEADTLLKTDRGAAVTLPSVTRDPK